MFHPKRRKASKVIASALGVGGVFGLGASVASAAEPTQQELMEQIEALRSKVQQLEANQAQQGQAPADARSSSREVDATIGSVLNDADRRSQLLSANGFTAGIDRGKIIIRSEDNQFLINPNFQFQFRHVWNYREEDAATEIGGDATGESGFEVRRLKMAFEGHAFGEETKYKFQWSNKNTSDLTLEEAFIAHKFADQWAVKVGQYKDVTFHEEITSSKRQLAVDRSLANEVLGGGQTDYIQGVALIWDDGAEGLPLRGEFGYTDGPNSDNTNFEDGGGSALFGVASPDYGAYGRVEYLVMGRWRQYDDFTAMDNEQDLLAFGAGAFYVESGDGNAIFHTVDAQFETGPIGLYGAYYGVYGDPGEGGDDTDDDSQYSWGLVAQAGYMLNQQWEAFGRYSFTDLDQGDDDSGDGDSFCEITAGVNYYFRGHAAKFTADVVWLPDGTPTNETGLGVLDPDADAEQFAVRAQFQLLL